jgi:hypothetical protein
MNALTSAGWLFVPVDSLIVSPAHEHRLVPDRSHCFMCLAFCTIPSPTTPLPPAIALTRYPSAWQASEIGLGFARCQEARQTERTNRVHFRYGLVILLQLFPTPPHDDAVTFRYRPESGYRKRTSISPTKHTNSQPGRPKASRGRSIHPAQLNTDRFPLFVPTGADDRYRNTKM